jgi:hypothetical protein
MKKSVQIGIRKRAESLPVIMTTSTEDHIVDGQTLLNQGHTHWGAEEIVPWGEYKEKFPVKMAVNHYRRMRDAFDKHGIEGIKMYEDSVADIIEKRNSEKKS